MNELINKYDSRATIRWKLLTTASAIALLGSGYLSEPAQAADTDHPLLWIELSGQLNQLDAQNVQFAPTFVLRTPRPAPETVSPLSVSHAPRFGFEQNGKLSFQPEQSDWIFSASIRYGRSSSNQHLRQQSAYPTKPLNQKTVSLYPVSVAPVFRHALQFMDTVQKNSESHAVLDFEAGKDVGLGIFGGGSSSVMSVGVRFAQFNSRTNSAFKSDPDAHPKYFYIRTLKVPLGGVYHSYQATANITRSFHGVGPSLSWSASVPLAGNTQDGQLAFDVGANAAILFGRQRAKVHQHETGHYFHGKYRYSNPPVALYPKTPPDQTRSRSVTVPNLGAFAGASFNYASAKISLGYRADFFFNAIDGGVDTRKSENRGFFGPYASISIGIGD